MLTKNDDFSVKKLQTKCSVSLFPKLLLVLRLSSGEVSFLGSLGLAWC